MLTTPSIPSIVEKVTQKVNAARKQGVPLHVGKHKFEDDWLYIVVLPSEDGVRASDHAHVMTKIERELKAEGIGHVLLVPALED